MLTSLGQTGHSADVRMHLSLEARTLSAGQLGPDCLILDEPIDHPPATARLFFALDENEREWNVHLPEGISAGSRRVVIARTS